MMEKQSKIIKIESVLAVLYKSKASLYSSFSRDSTGRRHVIFRVTKTEHKDSELDFYSSSDRGWRIKLLHQWLAVNKQFFWGHDWSQCGVYCRQCFHSLQGPEWPQRKKDQTSHMDLFAHVCKSQFSRGVMYSFEPKQTAITVWQDSICL